MAVEARPGFQPRHGGSRAAGVDVVGEMQGHVAAEHRAAGDEGGLEDGDRAAVARAVGVPVAHGEFRYRVLMRSGRDRSEFKVLR